MKRIYKLIIVLLLASPAFSQTYLTEDFSSGEMPPMQYKIIHGNARLTDAQRQQLIEGFRATFGNLSEGNERD